MKSITIDLNSDFTEAVREAVQVLRAGGIVVYPTDTVYGLGANALDSVAVNRVFRMKKRSTLTPMPSVVKNILWAKELAFISPLHEDRLAKVWPGKVTVVLPKREIVPSVLVGGSQTIGMRVPDHLFVDKLLGKFGYPVTGTSANLADQEPARDPQYFIEVLAAGGDIMPDLVIDAGVLPESAPSTVMDLTGPEPKILRIGAAKPQELLELLQI